MTELDKVIVKPKSPKNPVLANEFAAIGCEIKLDAARQVLAKEYQADLTAATKKLETKLASTIAKARSRYEKALARAEKEIAKTIATPERLARAFRQALLHNPQAQIAPPPLPTSEVTA